MCTADRRRRQNQAADAEWLEQRASLVSVAEADRDRDRSSRSQKHGSGADDGDAGDNGEGDAGDGDAGDNSEGDAGVSDRRTVGGGEGQIRVQNGRTATDV